jgi:hypothetical protein
LATFERDVWLDNHLSSLGNIYLGTEKARSEFIVAPILHSFSRRNKLSVFSGYEFNIDKQNSLNGFCDFILSTVNNSVILEAPAFFVVETKRIDIDDNAIAQCAAELYAAQIFNEQNKQHLMPIYGCATSGYSWAMLKLANNVLSIDPNYVPFTFGNPYFVLNTLQWILEKSR